MIHIFFLVLTFFILCFFSLFLKNIMYYFSGREKTAIEVIYVFLKDPQNCSLMCGRANVPAKDPPGTTKPDGSSQNRDENCFWISVLPLTL